MTAEEDKYRCKYCSCSYKCKKLLKSHTADKHKAYKCSICNERCVNIEDMRFHIKKVHLGHVTCPLCDKIFANGAMCLNHTQEHWNSASTPQSPGERSAHHSEHNPPAEGSEGIGTLKEDRESLRCDKCGLYFDNEYRMREHQATHKAAVFKCGICAFESLSRECVMAHMNDEHLSFQEHFKEII